MRELIRSSKLTIKAQVSDKNKKGQQLAPFRFITCLVLTHSASDESLVVRTKYVLSGKKILYTEQSR